MREPKRWGYVADILGIAGAINLFIAILARKEEGNKKSGGEAEEDGGGGGAEREEDECGAAVVVVDKEGREVRGVWCDGGEEIGRSVEKRLKKAEVAAEIFSSHIHNSTAVGTVTRVAEMIQNRYSLSREGDEEQQQQHQGRGKRKREMTTTKSRSAEYFSILVAEIAKVGWDLVTHINESMSQITFGIREDAGGRIHSLRITLPSQVSSAAIYSSTYPPICESETPLPFEPNFAILRQEGILDGIVKQFSRHLEQFRQAWDILDDLDKNTWILEPSSLPCYSSLSRRIVIGKHRSIHLRISASAPYALCECVFLGADTQVGPLRTTFNSSAHLWDASGTTSVRKNLENILGFNFPSKPDTSKPAGVEEEFDVNCAICYQYQLIKQPSSKAATTSEGNKSGTDAQTSDQVNTAAKELPDIVCENAKCSRPFHPSCLVEWLRSIPSTRQSFTTLFGLCPFCGEGISVTC